MSNLTEKRFFLPAYFPKILSIAVLFAFLLYGLIILQRAWLCDDSYITFRTADNFVNGYRLTWNTDERVQAYTHPLWLFTIIPFYFLTREVYLTVLLLSLVISLAALSIFIFKVAKTRQAALLGVLILALSNAYVDYSTSGLENPLSHLILILFLWMYFNRPLDVKTLLLLSFIASLGLLNRMDLALIYAPVLVFSFWRVSQNNGFLRSIAALILGQLPFILWELFSIFYYGFLFPNTAYSKITTAISATELFVRGLYYALNSLQHDPLTLVVVLTVVVLTLKWRVKSAIPVALGILLYILYVVKIGGDFMSGRFFAAPLLCAVVVLAQFDFDRLRLKQTLLLYVTVILLGLAASIPTFLLITPYAGSYRDARDIADERRAFYSSTGLLRNRRFNTGIDNHWAEEGKRMRVENPYGVIGLTNIGFFGYYAGPHVHIIDYYGLSDPLIARIPPKSLGGYWRAGHLERIIPQGYVFTVESGGEKNWIADEHLAEYYDKLAYITRGDLFDPQRFIEIWKMNTGQYDHLIDFYLYRYPRIVETEEQELGEKPIQFTEHGIRVHFADLIHPSHFEVRLSGNARYEIVYQRGIEVIAKDYLNVLGERTALTACQVTVAEKAKRSGFDRLIIVPVEQRETEFWLQGLRFFAYGLE
ncbi:MAG: hypothetical protein HPY45_00965 [Anaerolineae bacterium]|nr:hypothetical protein [Anaerolineae bacterium]